MKLAHGITPLFETLASKSARILGSSTAFICAIISILIWALFAPVFGFNENWQLIINTSGTIITLFLLFLNQIKTLHLKIDLLLKDNDNISDSNIDLELLPEIQLDEKISQMEELAKAAKFMNIPEDSLSSEEFETKNFLFEKIASESGSNPKIVLTGTDGYDTLLESNDSEPLYHSKNYRI